MSRHFYERNPDFLEGCDRVRESITLMQDIDWGLRCPGISVPHFFGTRNLPPFLRGRIQVGYLTEGEVDLPWVVALRQIHSNHAVVLKSPLSGGPLSEQEGDALVTDHPRTMILIRTADCVPVLFVDDRAGVVAAVHAGWRGIISGIVSRIIGICLREFGASPKRLQAAIGPSIGPCCYEVDEPVIGPVRLQDLNWREVLRETAPGKAQLDLKGLIRHQMLADGLLPGNIACLDLCTHCRPDLFYSYRREGQVKETMVSGIMLPVAP
jgi:polyphenol oxidase